MPITSTRSMRIGTLASETGVKVETIRYYERIGLMKSPERTAGGTREYGLEDLKRLSFIRRSRELGFSQEEIRALLRMVDAQSVSCAQVHEMTLEHLANIRRKIMRLQRLETALESMAAECSKGDVPKCPVVEVLYEAQ